MVLEAPLWLQAGTYPARLDRMFIEQVMRGQNRVFSGLAVTQRAAGANFTVDISAGPAVVKGTTQAFQGMYFIRSTAVANIAVPSTPATTRTDSVVATIQDPDGGGTAGNNWILQVVQGTTPPENSLVLATIARTSNEAAILAAAITDLRPLGQWSWTVSTTAPTGKGVPGDLWVVV